MLLNVFLLVLLPLSILGGAVGAVEGCFLNPIPGSTTPMLVRALGVIARRGILFGKCFPYMCIGKIYDSDVAIVG